MFIPVDAREFSIFKRLTFLQFLNTTVITTLASVSYVSDFNWEWFRDVGTDLLVICLLQYVPLVLPFAIGPTFTTVFSHPVPYYHWLSRRLCGPSAASSGSAEAECPGLLTPPWQP